MQRTYPGQLPAVRRDSNNIVFPVDLTSTEDADIVVKTIQVFVKNKIPVRFGLIPVTFSDGAIAQLKVAHYLQETFGLASFMDYLEAVRTNFPVPKFRYCLSVTNWSSRRPKISWLLRIRPASRLQLRTGVLVWRRCLYL